MLHTGYEYAFKSPSSSFLDHSWVQYEIAGAMENMLYDTRADWDVGTHSYRDVMGKPTIGDATIVMVPITRTIN